MQRHLAIETCALTTKLGHPDSKVSESFISMPTREVPVYPLISGTEVCSGLLVLWYSSEVA